MENLLLKIQYKFKKSYGGNPEPQTPQDAPWLHGPSLKIHVIYSGITLRSEIEAPLIDREVVPETYFLLVIMEADAQAGPFLQFQASC
jgi:hypothetical protein